MPSPEATSWCTDHQPHAPHTFMARRDQATFVRARCPGLSAEGHVTQRPNTEGREYTMADLVAMMDEVEARDRIIRLRRYRARRQETGTRRAHSLFQRAYSFWLRVLGS